MGQGQRKKKKWKISYNTFDRKSNLIYFVPLAQRENESKSTGSNLWDLRNDIKKRGKNMKEKNISK